MESKERGRYQEIVFADETRQDLEQLIKLGKLDFYDSFDDVEELIK